VTGAFVRLALVSGRCPYPPGAFGPGGRPGQVCDWGAAAGQSWWTPMRIAAVLGIAIVAAVVLGLALAFVRYRVRDRRFMSALRADWARFQRGGAE